MKKSEQHPEIPTGYYCYNIINGNSDKFKTKPCPYWGRDLNRPTQENGFCRLLDLNDWTDNTLLWDQIKECGINED